MDAHRRVDWQPFSFFIGACLRCLLAAAIVLGAFGIAAVSAQTTDKGSRIYRVSKTSTFQQGCFAPCLCPVMEQGTEDGTFILTPAGSDGLFDKYTVSDVNWIVARPGGDVRVTGSGTYKVGGEFAVQQQLSLDLKVGDSPLQHFDSGLAAGGGQFPKIDVRISINGEYCFDTVFELHAAPAPAELVHPYLLLPKTTFQRSCSGPCTCAPGPPVPMRGTFDLVELDPDPLVERFAVVLAKWLVATDSTSPSTNPIPVTGSGTYKVGGEVAVEQQMTLDLSVGKHPSVLFDSGRVQGGNAFPRIDVRMVSGEGTCVVTVIDLHAKPAPRKTTASPASE